MKEEYEKLEILHSKWQSIWYAPSCTTKARNGVKSDMRILHHNVGR